MTLGQVAPTAEDAISMLQGELTTLKHLYQARLLELYDAVRTATQQVVDIQSVFPQATPKAPAPSSNISVTPELFPNKNESDGLEPKLLDLFRESLFSEKERKVEGLMAELAETQAVLQTTDSKLSSKLSETSNASVLSGDYKTRYAELEVYAKQLRKENYHMRASLTKLKTEYGPYTELRERYDALEKRSKIKYDEYRRQLDELRATCNKLTTENSLLKHDERNVSSYKNELSETRLKLTEANNELQKCKGELSLAAYDAKMKDRQILALRSNITRESSARSSSDALEQEVRSQNKLLQDFQQTIKLQAAELENLRKASLAGAGASAGSATGAGVLDRAVEEKLDRVLYTLGAQANGCTTGANSDAAISLARHHELLKAEIDRTKREADIATRALLARAEEDMKRRINDARSKCSEKDAESKQAVVDATNKLTASHNAEISKLREELISVKSTLSLKTMDAERAVLNNQGLQSEVARLKDINNQILGEMDRCRTTIEFYEAQMRRQESIKASIRSTQTSVSEIRDIIKASVHIVKGFGSGMGSLFNVLLAQPSNQPKQSSNTSISDLMSTAGKGSGSVAKGRLVFSSTTVECTDFASFMRAYDVLVSQIGKLIIQMDASTRAAIVEELSYKFDAEKNSIIQVYEDNIAKLRGENEKYRKALALVRDQLKKEFSEILCRELSDTVEKFSSELADVRTDCNDLARTAEKHLSLRSKENAELKFVLNTKH